MDSAVPRTQCDGGTGCGSPPSSQPDVVFLRAEPAPMPAQNRPPPPSLDRASAEAIVAVLAADVATLDEAAGGRGNGAGPSTADDEALARALAAADAAVSTPDAPSTSDAADAASDPSALFDLYDPTPDVHGLFAHYNALYFNSALAAVSVEWAPRMTLCAGTCTFSNSRGDAPRIRLSAPLLSLRPPSDLKNTLLHEMVHAAVFLSGERDPGGHGPRFMAHAARINAGRGLSRNGGGYGGLRGAGPAGVVPDPLRPRAGYRIEVYHSFHAEVESLRVHHWACTGPCGTLVKRASNRAPQPADCVRAGRRAGGGGGPRPCDGRGCWWHGHAAACGGGWVKVAGPPPKGRGRKKADGGGADASSGVRRKGAAVAGTGPGQGSLDAFFVRAGAGGGESGSAAPPPAQPPKRSRSPSPVLVLDSSDDDGDEPGEGPIIVLDD